MIWPWEHKQCLGLSASFISNSVSTCFGTTLSRHQAGAIRTNCLDCLDRTNAIQNIIALHVRPLKINHIFVSISKLLNMSSYFSFNCCWMFGYKFIEEFFSCESYTYIAYKLLLVDITVVAEPVFVVKLEVSDYYLRLLKLLIG